MQQYQLNMTTHENAIGIDQQQNVSHNHDHHVHEETSEFENDQTKSKTTETIQTNQQNNSRYLLDTGYRCLPENESKSFQPETLIVDSKVYNQTKSKTTETMETNQSNGSPYLLDIAGYQCSPENEFKSLLPETLIVDSKTTERAKTDKPNDAEAAPKESSPTSSMEDNGRERLKRHRVEMAGRVWIPDIWGQEELLKDWIDCTSFDASLMNNTIVSAREALVEEGRRANSSRLRI